MVMLIEHEDQNINGTKCKRLVVHKENLRKIQLRIQH